MHKTHENGNLRASLLKFLNGQPCFGRFSSLAFRFVCFAYFVVYDLLTVSSVFTSSQVPDFSWRCSINQFEGRTNLESQCPILPFRYRIQNQSLHSSMVLWQEVFHHPNLAFGATGSKCDVLTVRRYCRLPQFLHF